MIILDNGHGDNTKGKRSPVWNEGSQLFEWEFNRDIVRRIHSRLTALRIPCTILVREARDISLGSRINRINSIYGAYPDSIGISIHGNASPEEIAGKGQGWEVWTSDQDRTLPKMVESEKLATILFTAASVMLTNFKMRSDMTDGCPDKEGHLFLLRGSQCPFVLSENGFYDNEQDCRFMDSDYGRELIAKTHVFAIENYLSTRQ